MTRPYETTTYPTARPITRRATQRSNLSTPEHEIHSAQQPRTFQPKSQNQEPNHESHLRITICGGREGCRPQLNTTPPVLILVGWLGC